MNLAQLNPGHGYIVRERLGRGRWKEVYRAVSRGKWHDRALARFIEEVTDPQILLNELKSLDRLAGSGSEHLARIYGAFKGDDGHIYLVEELLYRSLEALSPLRSAERFLQIARDLCLGLASLHELDPPFVHRDLKLDNCGIDYADRAKIFDLGSVTSEGGKVQGTTLTRAPELFKDGASYQKKSDVWALGAVLFALRCNHYPFVWAEEVRNRPFDGPERDKFDVMVKERALAGMAEGVLGDKIKGILPKGPSDLLLRMMAFDTKARPTANEGARQWDSLLRKWMQPAKARPISREEDAIVEISAFLQAALCREAGMSSMQWEKISTAIEGLEKKWGVDRTKELRSLQSKVKNLREEGSL